MSYYYLIINNNVLDQHSSITLLNRKWHIVLPRKQRYKEAIKEMLNLNLVHLLVLSATAIKIQTAF